MQPSPPTYDPTAFQAARYASDKIVRKASTGGSQ